MAVKRIVVTGAAGMVGSHLCDRLVAREDLDVLALDDFSVGTENNLKANFGRPNFRMLKLDVRDERAILAACEGAHAIVHLAARKKIGEQQPGIETLTVNTRGTETVLEAARANKARFVFASTSDVYGMSEELPFREDGNLVLGPSLIKRWAYAVSKLYSEQLAFAYHKDFGVPVVVLRYFGGFSDRASFSWSGGHVPLFVDAVLRGQPVTVHGDGSQTRSMGYVEDLVEGTMLAMESPQAVGEIINLGNPEEMSVIDCAKRIHELSGRQDALTIKYVPMAEIFGAYRDIQRRRPDISKAKKLLGWEPRYSFEDALKITIESRRRQLDQERG
jgi:UDP-glucose 4-epimerase